MESGSQGDKTLVGIIHGCLLCSDLGLTPAGSSRVVWIVQLQPRGLKGGNAITRWTHGQPSRLHGERKAKSKPTIGQKGQMEGMARGPEDGRGKCEGLGSQGKAAAPSGSWPQSPGPPGVPIWEAGTSLVKGQPGLPWQPPVQFHQDSAC